MNPPPLDRRDTVLLYLKAGLFVLPSFLIWNFAHLVLLPKANFIWQKAGLTTSSGNWLMVTSNLLMDNARVVFFAIFAVILILEVRPKFWARYRKAGVYTLVITAHCFVLVGLTILTTSVLLAVPMLMGKK